MASTLFSVDPWALVAAVICAAISARVILWRPDGHQYKAGASLLAWVLSASSGCYALSVVLYSVCGQPVAPVSPWLVCLLLVMAVLLYRARGNVAAFVRVDWDRPWSGVERRRG
ncbi:phage holin family protein [Metapseudomonas otitidis]|uniref:phage holin family protein n=1 Tax=Metapseudomonas otitidis TaxID=319939 RepID=UPI0025402036|nr:phage holin family protein [Pseudomonas otitidis]WIF69739.1 phage holin family protein [Pseudomonas otitidis]